MARIRSIKPEFFKSLSVGGNLSIPARLHFIGLWTYADDEGRALDDCRLLKAELWPLDDAMTAKKIDQLQGELAGKGRIIRYRVGDTRLMQIVNFGEHQRIDRKTLSKYPAPTCRLDESSTSQQRAPDEGSSPDRIGSDRIGSEEASPPEPPPVDNHTVEEKRLKKIIDLIAKHQLATRSGPAVGNTAAWLTKARANARGDFLDQIADLTTRFPEAPDGVIAAACLGDTHSLGQYRPAAPTEETA